MVRAKLKIYVMIVAAMMSIAMASCHSHKGNSKEDVKKYERIYIDDLYSGKERKSSKLYKEVKSWLGVPYKYAGH